MAAPRPLTRPELERVRWTERSEGCSPEAQHVQIGEVVRRVLRGGGRAAAVAVRIPAGLPVVAVDARRLESALAGLVDHAIRRNPAGARVLVRADAVSGRRGSGGIGGFGSTRGAGGGRSTGAVRGRGAGPAGAGGPVADRARVELRVVDRGPCELPEAREWLLAGLRPEGPVGPAGYGLIRAAGGRLAVEPTPGGGLTVVLILEVARD
ncbi:hypothetical protein [Kitasatospora sp. NPDC056181]|uniref:hypothetical protein n=1 Tax=Kitasatospora sp. NPDC056181 TaxID=3345737 RepID=UPI0035E1D6C1